MKVLLSIKPDFALDILSGQKKYEFRRNIFKRSDIRTAIIYATDPIQKIIGEFEIDEIFFENIDDLWKITNDNSGISRDQFEEYFKNKTRGYAIKVKEPRKYERYISLSELGIVYPPQSFSYINFNQSRYPYIPVRQIFSIFNYNLLPSS